MNVFRCRRRVEMQCISIAMTKLKDKLLEAPVNDSENLPLCDLSRNVKTKSISQVLKVQYFYFLKIL